MGDERKEAERTREERRAAELGNSPLAKSLLPLMDRVEAERRAIDTEAEPARLESGAAITARDFPRAAILLGEIAQLYRAHGFMGHAEQYERRAADCLTSASLSKKRKGGRR